jgi:hypothetical protein
MVLTVDRADGRSASRSGIPAYLVSLIVVLLLIGRDILGLPVNKYILLSIIAFELLVLDHVQSMSLMCFLMPLYVGLPGNYITLVLLAKLIYESISGSKNVQFRSLFLIATISAAGFISVQNVVNENVDMYNMICIAELVVVFLIFSSKKKLDLREMLFMYLAGVTMLGMIMLVSTLREHNLSDLLTSASRIGTAAVRTSDSQSISVYVDPNYYGYFSIAAISSAFYLLYDKNVSKIRKKILTILLFANTAIGLIGLSRAYIFVLLLWAMVTFLAKKGYKKFIVFPAVVVAALIIINQTIPGVFEGIWERFHESDMATANGRTQIIGLNYLKWISNFYNMMFGIGLFKCNVHCMQLQYLFGTGFVGAAIILLYSVQMYQCVRIRIRRTYFSAYIPIACTMIMAATVPVANSMTFMFPTIIALYALDLISEVLDG